MARQAAIVPAADQEDASSGASRRLERAIAAFARRRDRYRAEEAAQQAAMSAPAFRAAVAQRLRALERDVAEVRSRINGLLFVVAGAVVTQVVLRLFGA